METSSLCLELLTSQQVLASHSSQRNESSVYLACTITSPDDFSGCDTYFNTRANAKRFPCYAEDGVEEAEIAGVYLVDATGGPGVWE